MVKIDLFGEIKNTVALSQKGRLSKPQALNRLDSILQLRTNPLFNGSRRKIKKEVFKAKKLL